MWKKLVIITITLQDEFFVEGFVRDSNLKRHTIQAKIAH